MGLIVGNQGHSRIKIRTICDFCFLLFMCALSGNKSEQSFDIFFYRISFFAYFYMVLLLMYSSHESKKKLLGLHTVWYGFLMLFLFFSLFWSESITNGIRYFSYYFQIFVMSALISYCVRTRQDLEKYLKLVLISLCYMGVLLLIRTPTDAWGILRFGAQISLNENDFGVRCAYGAIISLYFFQTKSKWSIILILAFSSLTFFSGSRTAFGVLVLGLVCYTVISAKGVKIVWAIALAIIIFSVIWILVMNNATLYRILGSRIANFLTGGAVQEEGSMYERTFIAKQALSMFLERPILGWGVNSVMTKMQKIGFYHVTYSHSNFMELLATTGGVGFALYYSFYYKIFVKIQQHRKENILVLTYSIAISSFFEGIFFVDYSSVFIQILLVFVAIGSGFFYKDRNDIDSIYIKNVKGA